MRSWDTFEHDDAYDDLSAIAHTATSMGAQTCSCGQRKLTIQWPDGCIVHLRRFVSGKFRWLLFTQEGRHAILLSGRDPNVRELRDPGADPAPSTRSGEVELAGMGTAWLSEL
jgi:hypothetical protein